MSYTPDWFTGLLLADTSVNSGSVTLPSASTMIGRMITIKDPKGTYAQNSLTISTLVDSDQFEDGTSTVTLNNAFDYMTFIAGYGANSIPTWFQVGGSKVSTIQTNILGMYDRATASDYTQLTLSSGYLLADGNFISTNYSAAFPDNFSVNTLITSTTITSSLEINSGITTEFLNVGTLSTIENPSFSTFQLWDTQSNAYYTMSLSATTLLAGTNAVITGIEVTVPQVFVTSSLTTSTLIAQNIAAPYQFPIQTLNFQPTEAFSPSSLTNLVGWFDASDSNYVGLTGGKVETWYDKSPIQSSFTQSVATQRPSYANNSIVFQASSSNHLYNTYGEVHNCSNTSIFIVVETAANSDMGIFTGYTYHDGDLNNYADNTSPSTFTITNAFNWYRNPLQHNSTIIGDVQPASSNSLPKAVYEYIVTSNGNANNFVTGGLRASNISLFTSNYPVSPNTLYLGCRVFLNAPNNFLDGNIYEILYYNQALSDTNRQTVEGYLAWKWGLQSNLPARHPFRWSQPS